jgi:hypothetical protein
VAPGCLFSDAGSKRLVDTASDLFKSERVFATRDRHFLFVCGGSVEPGSQSMRAQFLGWASVELPDFIILNAEDAFRETLSHKPLTLISLSRFESLIADISDCVLIFPESEGSFAELGVFSRVKLIRDKTLVANKLEYQAAQSFVNLGPIREIQRLVYINCEPHVNFSPVKEGLRPLSYRSRRRRFHYRAYGTLRWSDRLLAVWGLLDIFDGLTLEDLHAAVKSTFGFASFQDLRHLLSILLTAGYVVRCEEYFSPAVDKQPLLEFDHARIEDLRGEVAYYYLRCERHVYDVPAEHTRDS